MLSFDMARFGVGSAHRRNQFSMTVSRKIVNLKSPIVNIIVSLPKNY